MNTNHQAILVALQTGKTRNSVSDNVSALSATEDGGVPIAFALGSLTGARVRPSVNGAKFCLTSF